MLCYEGRENVANYDAVKRSALAIAGKVDRFDELSATDWIGMQSYIAQIADGARVVVDITGLSRLITLRLLTLLYRRRIALSLLYTEAKEYYPRRADFAGFLAHRDPSDAFGELISYEAADIMYSSECRVEQIPELPGHIFPTHPVMLIAFLAFKRSRLSCILSQYETNFRVFVKSVPVRRDLRWRARALEVINFDLLEENLENIEPAPTLDWIATFRTLSRLYDQDNRRYRFNVLLAPLGGKMQTIGAWYFAVTNPDVRVITSTPGRHFPDKYSIGWTRTHWVPMDAIYTPDLLPEDEPMGQE